MAERSSTLDCAKAPTGRNLDQHAYWESLKQSFNKQFIEDAWERYGKGSRLPLD
jgi:hypothetical protein